MPEDLPSRELVEELIRRIEHLELVLQSNTARLHAVERRLGLTGRPLGLGVEPAPVAPPRRPAERPRQGSEEGGRVDARTASDVTPSPGADGATGGAPPPPSTTTTSARGAEEARPRSWADPVARERAEGEAAGARAAREGDERSAEWVEPEPARARRDLETFIGGSLFAWVGIIAGAVAVALFLKEAFERDWIGPSMRVAVGAALGVGLLGLGERLRGRGLRQYAFVLSGGGILVLYLSIYAAFNFYQLLGQPAAFLLMALVTATAVLLSVRLDALAVAVLGLLGGFATPLLLSTGKDNQVALFTYVALLDAGVLAVAYFKRWRSLNFISFAATVLMTFGWLVTHYRQEKLWATVFFLSVFFVLYSLLAVVHNVLPRRPARWYDVLLVSANATFYFGLSYSLLYEAGYGRGAAAAQALALSAAFALLYLAVRALHRDDRLVTYAYVGAAVTFLTVAAAIRLELHWVTIAWAVEGLALAWAGVRANEPALRHSAVAVACVAAGHWLGWDVPGFAFKEGAAFVPLVNRRALSCAILVATMAASARLYGGAGDVEEGERTAVNNFYVLAASGLALTLLTLDINDYFGTRLAGVAADEAERRAVVENTRQFSVTTLWALYGGGALVLGVLRRLVLLRYAALLLLAACVAKVLAVDSGFYSAAWHAPVFNHTFGAYAFLALALAACARFYARGGHVAEAERAGAVAALLFAANFVALAGLSLEALGFYDRVVARLGAGAAPADITRLNEGKAFALGLIWSAHGAAAFLYGLRRDSRAWRYGGLLLIVLASIKALAWDLRYYDAAWHAPVFNRTLASFAVLVAAMWLVVRGYARSERISEEELTARPFFTVFANVLAVIALSAEASGHFAAQIGAAGGGRTEQGLRDLWLARQLALSVVWAVYGGALLLVGRLRRSRLLRLMSLALLGLTTLKVFFWDLSSLDRVYRIISFIVLGAILLAVSYLYQKSQQQQRAAD
ncbi:MAG TPA: DUF2339 domain-containing protein [Pyrinomonadaceae bacterium]|nr:DUF2339 domain-containing protein [Pyrinomonadaceae bacterium]